MILLNIFSGGLGAVSSWVQTPVFDSSTTYMTMLVSQLSMGLALFCFAINLICNYAKETVNMLTKESGSGLFFDLNELIRALLVLFALFSYPAISASGVEILETFNKATTPGTEQAIALSKSINEKMAASKEASLNQKVSDLEAIINNKDVKREDRERAKKMLSVIKEENYEADGISLLNFSADALLELFAIALMQGVKLIILPLTLIIWRVLIILAPIAFALSLLPISSMKDCISSWFSSVLTIGLSFTTINILDHLVGDMFLGQLTRGEDVNAMVFYVFIIIYIMTFWLTAKVTGSKGGGAFVSKVVGVSAAVGALAAQGALAGAGALGGGSGGAAGAASAASEGSAASSGGTANTISNIGKESTSNTDEE